jgi:NAD(P)-dependent dehydrogenase (short-subunit alcohol dehydrogenase family)
MDVADAESVEHAVETVMQERQRIDAVVNNAGIMSIGLAEGFTEEQLLHAMNINFMGAFRVSRAVLPPMDRWLRSVVVSQLNFQQFSDQQIHRTHRM